MQFVAPYSLVPAGNLALRLHPDHLADLRASGLLDETILSAGVYSLAPGRIRHFFPARKGVPVKIQTALCFPYQGGDFARIKLFPALGKMKYAQPLRTSARLYLPFPVGPGAVVIAEGEKKALAAHQAGLNTLGIGGLWNWLGHGQPIEDLGLIDWESREATIIPDSDIWLRPDLLKAVYALGRELQSRGACVYVAEIPQHDGAKVGLDDYLLAGGKASDLEVFALGHRVFKGAKWWHGKWGFKKALEAA